jgi:hypothetical protein
MPDIADGVDFAPSRSRRRVVVFERNSGESAMAWNLPKGRVPYVSALAMLAIAAGGCSNGPPKNQDQSGVTNSSSGKSTLANPQQTEPTAGQPVTAKGDTLKRPDSTMGKRR